MKRWLHKWSRKMHTWIGYVMCLQMLAWFLSGVVMTTFPIDLVRGTTYAAEKATPLLSKDQPIISIDDIIRRHQLSDVTGARLVSTHSGWVHQINTQEAMHRYDAFTGNAFEGVSETEAREVALSDFTGEGQLISSKSINEIPHEDGGGKINGWQFQFDDLWNTRIYVEQSTGRIVKRRNTVWRVYDFFWMLHIMDYEDRSDTNNWLLISFAITGTLFVITGLILLLLHLRPRHFKFFQSKKA